MKQISLVFLLCFLASCATVSTLPGGDKDTSPPKLLSSSPDSAQTEFFSKELRLVFDEYFTIQNLNKHLIVSPPFDERISSKIKGKNLILQFPEYPKTQTTYQLHFGEAIRDVNEGNILRNFSLVFSTGSVIDSGTISGSVLNSETLLAETPVKLFLYREYNDSNVFSFPPYYVTLTDSFGNFRFSHLADNLYQIVALKDDNGNNRLDYGESVGFVDPLVPSGEEKLVLRLFNHLNDRPVQLMRSSEVFSGVFSFSFNRPVDTSQLHIIAQPISQVFQKSGLLPFSSTEKLDALTVYVSSKDASREDSLLFTIVVEGDTLLSKVRRKKKGEVSQKLTLANHVQLYNKEIVVQSATPLLKTKVSGFTLTNLNDSSRVTLNEIYLPLPFEMKIKSSLQKGTSYRLILDTTSTFYFNGKHTTIDTFYFRTLRQDELGNIEMSINVDSSTLINSTPLYVELFSKNALSRPIFREVVKKDTLLLFNNLIPGEYFARAFFDSNSNKKWTSGNYVKKRQSEQVFIKLERIIVRANWETKNIVFLIK